MPTTDTIDTFLKGTMTTLKEQQHLVDVYLPIVLTIEDAKQVQDLEGKIDLQKLYKRCIIKAAETYQKGQHGTSIYTSQTKEYKRRTERVFNQFLPINPQTGQKQYACILLVKPEGQSKLHGQNKRSLGLTPAMIKNLANKFHGIILDNSFPGVHQFSEEQ